MKLEDEEVEEEEEDDEGPPPGFQCITVQQQKETMEADQNEQGEEEEEDDSDGPPPGWSPIPQPAQRIQTPDAEMFDKQDDDDDEDEDDDNGPPPGWDMPPPTPQLAKAISSGDMEGKQEGTKAEASIQPMDQSTLVSQPPVSIPSLPAPATLVPSEKGQLVCGSCRQLLSYPRGAKYVQCSCCQTVNLVLEAHQVGQVKCGGCAVLLMYPYGAPSVKCSSCCFLTEIGEHNRRLPLSVQQERRQPLFNRVH